MSRRLFAVERACPALLFVLTLGFVCCVAIDGWSQERPIDQLIAEVQPKVVKLFGAGGFRRLEAYQTGVLISADGYILTTWSHLIAGDPLNAVLDSGERLVAKPIGFDPILEIALLKLDTEDRPYFEWSQPEQPKVGQTIFAFTNAFGTAAGIESASIQRGSISGLASLEARRGSATVRYRQPVMLLDAITNNPGAAGGAIVDSQGHLLGIVGNELQDARNRTYINFGIPIRVMEDSISKLRSGQQVTVEQFRESQRPPVVPWSLEELGIGLVPNALPKTPPFVDRVAPGSRAEQLGLMPDDLIVQIDSVFISTCNDVSKTLASIDRSQPVSLIVQRAARLVQVNFDP